MLILIIGAVTGAVIGVFLPYEIPINFVQYTAVAILAGLDSILGGIRAQLEQKFNILRFISSFFTNTALAALLAYIGSILGVDITAGAVVAFSIRLFQNLSITRELLFDKFWWWQAGGSKKEDM